MTMKLVQKSFLNGSREYEIVDDTLFVRIKSLLKEEKSSVDLSTLDPEPVTKGEELQFFSPHKGRPILSLMLNKPDAETFNAFVSTLQQCITGEDEVVSVSPETAQSALARNVHEQPPAFAEPDDTPEKPSFKPVNPERLAGDITMLKTYVDAQSIKPLLDALESLQAEPANEQAYDRMIEAFDGLGINQGAVLNYGAYLKVLLSKHASW